MEVRQAFCDGNMPVIQHGVSSSYGSHDRTDWKLIARLAKKVVDIFETKLKLNACALVRVLA